MIRIIGIALLILGALAVRGGLFPAPIAVTVAEDERVIWQQRRLSALGAGILMVIGGVVLVTWPQRQGVIHAVPAERWIEVSITEPAAEFAKNQLAKLQSPSGSGVRVVAGEKLDSCELKFDLPSDDSEDYVGEDRGIIIFVHSSNLALIGGKSIDLVDGKLVLSKRASTGGG